MTASAQPSTGQDTTARETQEKSRRSWLANDLIGYVPAVLTGAALVLMASINQPLNQNELLQVGPYGSDSVGEITGGTRQPPIDPLLGSLVQHLFGVGQLQQRLVPALAGIGTLIMLAVLLRRLGAGLVGAGVVLFLATMPLFVRYSAYTRPYALPVFLMLVFAVSAQVWLDTGRRRWLLLGAIAAAALPATRVPEPTIFLVTTALTLTWLGVRGRITWNRSAPLIGIAAGAVLLVGLPEAHILAKKARGIWDPNPTAVSNRFDDGLDELVHGFLPLLGNSLPWWPLLALLVVVAFSLPASRRRLAGWWFFWPLLAAPVVFVLAYHFLTDINFARLPYRARGMYFFTPSAALALASIALSLPDIRWPRWGRGVLAAGLGVALFAQLPAAVEAATQPDVPDYAAAARLIDTVPRGAVVLFDRPGPLERAHQSFQAPSRYLSPGAADPVSIVGLAKYPGRVPETGDIYLMVDGNCIYSPCDPGQYTWTGDVAGWRLVGKASTFSLYGPKTAQHGKAGAAAGLLALSRALGPKLGVIETFAAAAILRRQGLPEAANQAIRDLYRRAGPAQSVAIRAYAAERGLPH
jgi:hypothetical protein